ncbi:MAG: LPS export ABC transporter periplasmic protein LptC [Deltaproteobacteria bacterium]|nr:LPS export ABC transporter periplasmic protein LptC [Deltaproteobacteria bacterium]
MLNYLQKHYRSVIVLFLCLLTIVSLSIVVVRRDPGVLATVPPGTIDLLVKNFHYTEVGNPEALWEIDADTAQYQRDLNLATLTNVTVKISFPRLPTVTMKGDKGSVRIDTKNVEIMGNVTIRSERGESVATERIEYDHGLRTFRTDKPVTINHPAFSVSGTGAVLVLDEKKLTLLSSVTAVFNGGRTKL